MKRVGLRCLGLALMVVVMSAMPVAAEIRVGYGIRDNGSFETGDLTGWIAGISHGADPCWVAGPGVSERVPLSFEVEPSDGDYAFVTLWSNAKGSDGDSYLLATLLDVPEGVPDSWRPALAFEYRAVVQETPTTGAPGLHGDWPVATLTVVAGVGDRVDVADVVYTTTVQPGMDTGNVTGVVDLSAVAGQDVVLYFAFGSEGENDDYQLWGQIDNVRLVQIPERERSDVSVIVYGGWGGIPVDAWAGAVPQERQYTAVNAFGEQQAMWSFWVDAGNDWQVTTQPTLPAGLDPDKWEYLLIRTASPTMGWTNESPSSGTLDILPGEQYIITYQLYYTG